MAFRTLAIFSVTRELAGVSIQRAEVQVSGAVDVHVAVPPTDWGSLRVHLSSGRLGQSLGPNDARDR